MDDLASLFEETGVDPNVQVEAPKSVLAEKDGQSSSTKKDPKSGKPSTSQAGKAAEARKKKRGNSERGTPTAAEGNQAAAEKGREPEAHKDKRMKGMASYDPDEEVTEADFAVMAKVVRLGVEGFKKMKKAVLVNTPDNLAGLLEENRTLQAEVAKNADLLKQLYAAEQEASENKKKAAELDTLKSNLETARSQLEEAKKSAEAAEVRAKEAEEKCQAARKQNAERAKQGYTRCLSQVLVIDPDFPVGKIHITQSVKDGKILAADGRVVFPEEKAADAEEKDAGALQEEAREKS